MPKYDVRVSYTITKVFTVEAESASEAEDKLYVMPADTEPDSIYEDDDVSIEVELCQD